MIFICCFSENIFLIIWFILDILNGKGKRTLKAAVALNGGAALYIGGKAKSIKEGCIKIIKAIDSGAVKEKLQQVKEESNA